MKSVSLSEAQPFLMNVGAADKKNSLGSNKGASAFGNFDQVLKDTSGKNEKTEMKSEKVDKSSEVTDKPWEKAQGTQKIQKENETTTEENSNSLEEDLREAAEKMKKDLMEQFNISDEELQKAMEALGLGWIDLLNPEALSKLVLQIEGVQDPLAFVTNGELYDQRKGLLETLDNLEANLKSQFQLTEEELKTVMEEIKETVHEETNIDLESPVKESGKVQEPVIEVVNISNSQEALKESQGSSTQNPAVLKEGQESQDMFAVKEEAEANITKQEEHKDGGQFTGQFTSASPNQSFVSHMEGAILANEIPVPEIPAKEIIEQIVQKMKITVSPEVNEMEMQLNPEHLGKLQLQVAVKNGTMTAHFTAENEAVKSAIENQVVQLKENLDQQGIKVEAVEVTIASHEFERNLQQGNRQNQEEESKKSQKGKVNLNLNGIESLEEEDLTGEERLEAEMMLQNGNTVSYTA